MNYDFNTLKPPTWVMLGAMFLSIVCPGVLFLYSFSYNLFISIDTFKLILLSSAIMLPTWVINIILVTLGYQPIGKDFKVETRTIAASCFNMSVLYLPIIINHFYKISLHSAINMVLVGQSFWLLLFLHHVFVVYKQLKKQQIKS